VLSGVCAGLAVQALPTMVLAAAALEVAVLLTARRRWRAGASVMAGGVASLLPFLVFLVATGTVAGFYEQAIAWTTGPYLRAHPRVSPLTPLPDWPAWYFAFPTRLLVLFTVFLVPAAVLLLPLWAWLRRRRYRLRREVVAIGVISSGLFLAESYRAGTPLLWYAAPLALLLAVCAGRSLLMRLAPRLPQLGLLLALPLLAALGPAAIGAAQHLRVGSHPGWQAVHASAVDVYSDAPAAAAMQTVIDFSRAHRQDGIAYYPALETMYLLSGQPPRVFYLTILPGVFTEQQVQAEESDLQAKQVRYLVYRRLPRQFLADVYPGAESALQGRQWEFETFIASNYREVQTLAEMRDRGSVVLYERR
jgi:hypothetical protein